MNNVTKLLGRMKFLSSANHVKTGTTRFARDSVMEHSRLSVTTTFSGSAKAAKGVFQKENYSDAGQSRHSCGRTSHRQKARRDEKLVTKVIDEKVDDGVKKWK